MSYPLNITVTESIDELRSLLKHAIPMMQPRIRMLMEIKEAGAPGISKRQLMENLGVCSQSVHNWRTAYKEGGIEALLNNGRKGKVGRISVISKDEHLSLEKKLKDPHNGLVGYVELREWFNKEFNKDVKYNTLLKYSERHFSSSVKAARKSHVKKDEKAVEVFKKNSLKK